MRVAHKPQKGGGRTQIRSSTIYIYIYATRRYVLLLAFCFLFSTSRSTSLHVRVFTLPRDKCLCVYERLCVCVYMYLVPRESPPLVVMLPRLFSFPFYVPLLVVCVHWREQGRCTGAGEGRRKGVGLGENNNNNKPASQPADKGTHGVNEEGGDRLGLLSEKKKREPRRREYGVHPHTHPTHRHTRALQKKALPNESATACVRCARKSARAMEEGSGERRLKAWTITKE